ncbi:MAG: type 2 isopentenyl-diphosphate Delta-isomerase [Candidatus Aenigmatarchaeota archaeon]
MSDKTSSRKDDHIRITKEEDVESCNPGFKDVVLQHEALPEIDKEEIDTCCEIFGNKLQAPILIDSITGGSKRGKRINSVLASAAEKCGIGIGVGSQRAALEDESLIETYSVVREKAPSAFVYGNIGVAQLKEYETEEVERAVDMIDADAMAVHLNFTQESIQPEGDTNAKSCLQAIEKTVEELSVPVIAKETGCGISQKTAEKLKEAGVDAINVGGRGGTSWPYIESYRARAVNEERKGRMGELFRDWGIPTAASVVMARKAHNFVISSGGVRNGVDVAKSIALGARCSAAAAPFLKAALEGEEKVVETIEDMEEGLKTAMFVTGSENLEGLSEAKVRIRGKTRSYVKGCGC